MVWEAANVPRREPRSTSSVRIDDGDDKNFKSSQDRAIHHPRRNAETVEAAISRLTKAYSVAMTCVGALRKASDALVTEQNHQPPTDEQLGQIIQVANAARTTLESAILIDPLVVNHARLTRETFQSYSEQKNTVEEITEVLDTAIGKEHFGGLEHRSWEFVKDSRPIPATVSSAAHQASIRDMAYAALVNYADLLWSSCACDNHHDPSNWRKKILPQLSLFGANSEIYQTTWRCCWKGEKPEDTQRLALVALCDASELDGSDPTLWLKLSFVARELGELRCRQARSYPAGERQYRRLERHALERGFLSLPPNLPPNRMIVRALEELRNEPEPTEYPAVLATLPEAVELVLEIPRYSWSRLGRMLMKACREGADGAKANGSDIADAVSFGCPLVVLHLSPMLVLPSRVVGIICLYLENESIWKFEATCRALSVSIIAARVELERGAGKAVDKSVPAIVQQEEVSQVDQPPSVEHHQQPEGSTSTGRRTSSSEQSHAASRTSKRLRSQQITSGKLAEKSSRRRSVEYCFLSATLSCTSDDPDYIATLQQGLPPWSAPCEEAGAMDSSQTASQRPLSILSASHEKLCRQQAEARERVADSSMSTFVERWSRKNSGPFDVMSKFLIHVALYVEDVFASDPGGVMALSSCFIDCLDVMSRRTGFVDSLGQFPFVNQAEFANSSNQQKLAAFAVNLLAAELKLRQCERGALENTTEQSETFASVSFTIAELMRLLPSLDSIFADSVQWVSIKTRTFWLAAVFSFFLSRTCQTSELSREAEQEGFRCLDEAIRCLEHPRSRPLRAVTTTHLQSPSRVGSHWSLLSEEMLTSFRDDLQASSVVSLAREKFLTTMEGAKEGTDENFQQALRSSLESIGESLRSRYNLSKQEPNDKLVELLDDFISLHGATISNHPFPPTSPIESDFANMRSRWGDIWDMIVPNLSTTTYQPLTSTPSIISIFLASYSIHERHHSYVVRLLGRLVFVAYTYQKSLLPSRFTSFDADGDHGGGADSDDYSDGDSFNDSSDDQSVSGLAHHRGAKGAQMTKPKLCIRLMQLFAEKIAAISEAELDDNERAEFATSEDCVATIRCCLLLCAEWYHPGDTTARESGELLDIEVFSSVKLLVRALCKRLDPVSLKQTEFLYFHGLSRIIVAQRKAFIFTLRFRKGGRAARSAHQKRCRTRAEFVASVSAETAWLLSNRLSQVRSGVLFPSDLLVHAESVALGYGFVNPKSKELALLCASLLWFWKYVLGFDFDENRSSSTVGNRADPRVGNSFDRPIVDQLRVPIAAALIALCGAAVHTFAPTVAPSEVAASGTIAKLAESLCLTEFFDTEASANELSSDDDSSEKSGTGNRELLRILCHAVHSVSLIFENVSDKEAVSLMNDTDRPLLPSVVLRVLNHFADNLLSHFGPHKGNQAQRKNLFEVEYPFRVRAIGRMLDESLYKAYKCLHGFVLLSSQQVNNDESMTKKWAPESITAAAQLYRCIKRAYGSGRRSPPRAALECVAMTLPPLPVTNKSKGIRNFLFSVDESYFTTNDIVAMVTEKSNWESRFATVSSFLTPSTDSVDDDVSELFIVQRGVCHQLAELPLPASASDTESKGIDEERATSSRTEEELMKKFNSVLDTLCSGDSLDCDSWHRAAQCAIMKADLVADRLGLSKGFSRNTSYHIPEHRSISTQKIPLSQLVVAQEQEFQLQRIGWIPFIGTSLSLYVQKSWCSFASLESCADEVRVAVARATTDQASETETRMYAHSVQVWNEIEMLKEKGNYVLWQQAWGSIFVAALRMISLRCECIALYSLFKQCDDVSDRSTRVSEICESLGINLYSELMGSQVYGYPMRIMTNLEKRELAEAARTCFGSAIDSINATEERSEKRLAWDLLFMIGKCSEKIAGTYQLEAFPVAETTEGAMRRYEYYMASALESYAASLKEAKALEDEKDSILEQAGGSAHGAVEVFYRLHASRLKSLISAVSQPESEIPVAEDEALTLTEKYWFLETKVSSDEKSVRDRVWDVFSDIVAALAQCKLDQPYFHRSVFRHAQALMWAPVLNDPILGRVEGSLGNVPISKGYRIRGLNSMTCVAKSAEVIMASLFEKKRAQLCAVWVTTACVPSPFQVLNSSVRKYDSLRGKYAAAYIESLRLSRKITQLEVFLQWTSSSRRDLPSYFQASAAAKGSHPEHPHTRDNLLIHGRSLVSHGFLRAIKRHANSAIGRIIVQEFSTNSLSARSTQEKASENLTRTAYACFLRLNCTIDELERSKAWKYGKVPEAEAVCQAYLALEASQSDLKDVVDSNDWSGGARNSTVLRRALAKFREMFPSITGNFYTKKATAKPRKQKSTDGDKLSSPTRNAAVKRKEHDHAASDGALSRRMSFTVSVPGDLKAGDHFHTTVKVGEQYKKVTLTVPEGSPRTLKFSLDIPQTEIANDSEEAATKRIRSEANPGNPP